MVVATLRIVVRPDHREDVLRTLRPLLGPTRVKPGCVSARLYQDLEDPNAIAFVEEWASRVDLERHVASAEYRKVLAAMDMAGMPPEIRFDSVAHTEGMELIEEIRSKLLAS